MRVLLATGHTYLPERVGGAESSIHELCLSLARAGVTPAVLARSGREAPVARLRRWMGRPSDEDRGYAVYRRPDPAQCDAVVRSFCPSVAIVQTGAPAALCAALEARGVPGAIYFRDMHLQTVGAPLSPRPDRLYLANSGFTAGRYRSAFGIDPLVLPPLVLPDRYRTPGRGDRVVFVNPHRFKGFDTVLHLARRRPDVRFEVVESWPLGRNRAAAVREQLRGLDNVSLRPRTADMRQVYSRARLILVPSIREPGTWEEGWGRVVTEAHCSGIPVLGSNSGGLPESIGPGGIVVDAAASPEAWEAAFSRIWDDPDEHGRLSAAALRHAARPEIAPDYLTGQLLDALTKLLADRVRPDRASQPVASNPKRVGSWSIPSR